MTTYTITEQQRGQLMSDAKSGAYMLLESLQPNTQAPDCRTCVHLSASKKYCARAEHWMKGCTNGDEYVETTKVVLWRTE